MTFKQVLDNGPHPPHKRQARAKGVRTECCAGQRGWGEPEDVAHPWGQLYVSCCHVDLLCVIIGTCLKIADWTAPSVSTHWRAPRWAFTAHGHVEVGYRPRGFHVSGLLHESHSVICVT